MLAAKGASSRASLSHWYIQVAGVGSYVSRISPAVVSRLASTANGSSRLLRGRAGGGASGGIGPTIGFCQRKFGPSWKFPQVYVNPLSTVAWLPRPLSLSHQ